MNSVQENVERVLFRVKVCKLEVVVVQNRFRNEYFLEWDEICEVIEVIEIFVYNLKDFVFKLEY